MMREWNPGRRNPKIDRAFLRSVQTRPPAVGKSCWGGWDRPKGAPRLHSTGGYAPKTPLRPQPPITFFSLSTGCYPMWLNSFSCGYVLPRICLGSTFSHCLRIVA